MKVGISIFILFWSTWTVADSTKEALLIVAVGLALLLVGFLTALELFEKGKKT